MHIFKFVDVVEIQSQEFEILLLPDDNVQIISVSNEGPANFHRLLRRTDLDSV